MPQKKKKEKNQKKHYQNTKRAGVPRKSLTQLIFVIFSILMLASMLLPSILPLLSR